MIKLHIMFNEKQDPKKHIQLEIHQGGNSMHYGKWSEDCKRITFRLEFLEFVINQKPIKQLKKELKELQSKIGNLTMAIAKLIRDF